MEALKSGGLGFCNFGQFFNLREISEILGSENGSIFGGPEGHGRCKAPRAWPEREKLGLVKGKPFQEIFGIFWPSREAPSKKWPESGCIGTATLVIFTYIDLWFFPQKMPMFFGGAPKKGLFLAPWDRPDFKGFRPVPKSW